MSTRRRAHTRYAVLVLACLLGVVGVAASSGSSAPRDPAATLRRGIELANEGNAELALERLDAVIAHADDPALVARASYAAGTVRLGKGELAQAIIDLRRTDADFPDPADPIRRDARFNLAHAMAGMVPADETMHEPEVIAGAVAQLRRAAGVFRDCLDVDPSDDAAARNAERPMRRADRLDQLRKMIEQARQQAGQSANQLQSLADRQDEQARRSASSDGSNSDQLNQDQSSLSQETQDMAEQLRQMAQQAREQGDFARANARQQAAQQMGQARVDQRRAEGHLGRNDPGQASPSQSSAADALRRAAEAARRASSGQPQQGQDGQQGQQGQDGSNNDGTGEPQRPDNANRPGDQTARDAIERERRLRQGRELQRGRLARPVPVEEDW